jgi:hypothetical protein
LNAIWLFIGDQANLANAALRVRVLRILANDIRLDDLTNIFLCIRNGCPSETIREIGDFVARGDVPTKGLVTDTAKDWLTMFEYQDWIRSNGRPADLSRRPSNTLAYLNASFRQADELLLLDQTGLTVSVAQQVLEKLLNQFTSNTDNTLGFTGATISQEYLLLSFLNRVNVYSTAFSGHQLFADLKSYLLSLRALKRSEIDAFDRFQPAIALFALSKMHNIILKIPGSESKLRTRVVHSKAGMMVKIDGIPWGRVFEATLNAEQYCEADLLSLAQPWECDVEVTPNLKLGKLG